MIVADTNLVAYLLIEGERTDAARRVWQRDPEWVLPPLWRAELLNVLATAERAGVVDVGQALQAWRAASRLFVASEREPRGEAVLEAAIRLGLSAYDAHFVTVAEELGLPLATDDRAILAAWPSGAVAIDDFAG